MTPHDNPKYFLTDDIITLPDGTRLRRIRALRNFGDGPGTVQQGELGGFIESENNLSHQENSWVYDNARVYGQARVAEDAQVLEDATVHGHAQLLGNAQVFGRARVGGRARLLDNAQVFGDAEIGGNAVISDNGQVYGNAVLRDIVWVRGDAQVYGTAKAIERTLADGSRPEAQASADGHVNGVVEAPADGLGTLVPDPFAQFESFLIVTSAREEVKKMRWGRRTTDGPVWFCRRSNEINAGDSI
jgi:carbonic anhydrase/acetyltransferase-like protein (isoleucine patch superfamily)